MNTLLFTRDGSWTLRDLKAAEAPRVLAILKDGGATEATVAGCFQAGSVMLVERGGEDAGCMVATPALSGWDSLSEDSLALWVTQLQVRPSFRRRGLGKALLGFAESLARAKGKSALRLLGPDKDPRLRAYLAALGFAPLGARPQDGQDLRLFEKPLR